MEQPKLEINGSPVGAAPLLVVDLSAFLHIYCVHRGFSVHSNSNPTWLSNNTALGLPGRRFGIHFLFPAKTSAHGERMVDL